MSLNLSSILLGGAILTLSFIFKRKKTIASPIPTSIPISISQPKICNTLNKLSLDMLTETEAKFVKKGWIKLKPYLTIICYMSKKYQVPTRLIYAIIIQESAINPKASRYEPHLGTYSYGLMQILLTTARDIGFKGKAENLFNPKINIEYGTKYLGRQLVRYNNDIKKAVAAYNAGSARYSNGKFINQHYVDKVMKYYEMFQRTIINV